MFKLGITLKPPKAPHLTLPPFILVQAAEVIRG